MISVSEGLQAIRRGDLDHAEGIFSKRLRENPFEAESLHGLALICLERRNPEFAKELLMAALERQPNFIDARFDLARILIAGAQYLDALELLGLHVDLLNNREEMLLLRGNALRAIGRLEEALHCYETGYAVEQKVEFAVNRSNVLTDLKRFEEAEEMLSSILSKNPDNEHVLFNFSLLQLRLGRWKAGWALQEKRPQHPLSVGWEIGTFPNAIRDKVTTGQAARILIYSEQGLGDVIQYLRFVNHPSFIDAELKLQVPTALYELVRMSFPLVSVCTDSSVKRDLFDFKVSLLSLPAALGLKTEQELLSPPYLRGSSQRSVEVRSLVRGQKSQRCIGIQWRGGGNPKLVNRSMPIEYLDTLVSNGDRFVSLRQSPMESEARWLADRGVIRFDSLMANFDDTAAVIENLDFVVTVDTSIAHLAGAMGKKTFLLLPYSAAWGWMESRSDSPWYPSMTLIRQKSPGDWASCITALDKML